MRQHFAVLAALACTAAPLTIRADEPQLPTEAAAALAKATDFFVNKVSAEGGYLWRYSEDLSRGEGEGKASSTTVWVQPPGTPTVGMAFLDAYRRTGEGYCLDAARKAGYCLARGQLRSGGWDYRIEFDPKSRSRYAYRVDAEGDAASRRNTSTLDDNTTQAALRLLMELDRALDFQDRRIHEAAEYALAALLAAQYPNGAWPQRFDEPPDAAKHPVKRASYPESWSRTFPSDDYKGYYTFNDNALADVIDVMFIAAGIYGDSRYRAAAEKGGDFMLLAQMPQPQPGWAQQYDADMHPAWARKFEPPSITGGESQGVMLALLQVYRHTGDKKYLEPIPQAVEYYRKSLLDRGQLARFYELETNRPLYFTKDYQLTYSDADMPTHYAFKVGQKLDRIEDEYRRLLAAKPEDLIAKPGVRKTASRPSERMISEVEKVIGAMDERGAWAEAGSLRYDDPERPTRRIIDCRTFIANVNLLSQYLAATE